MSSPAAAAAAKEEEVEEGEVSSNTMELAAADPVASTSSALPPPQIVHSAAPSTPSPPVSAHPYHKSKTLLQPPGSRTPRSSSASPRKRRISSVLSQDDNAEDPWKDESSAAYRAAKSASQWNGLLRWARKGRGPQWEWGTGMYHVDEGSADYYSGVVRIVDSAVPPHLRPDSAAQSHSAPGSPGGTPIQAGTYESGRPRRSRAAMSGAR